MVFNLQFLLIPFIILGIKFIIFFLLFNNIFILNNLIIVKMLLLLLPIILIIAFLTLLERKGLGAMQRRRGPNIVGIFGLLQPFADGVKLLLKENVIPTAVNRKLFIIAPIYTFILSLLPWAVIPISSGVVISDLSLGLVFLFAMSSLKVYGIIIGGWSSNSKYAFLGTMRSAAQMISYEISFGVILLPIALYGDSLNFSDIVMSQELHFNIFPLFPSFLLFVVTILAETNRLPFDFPEAESELVSGYNVEYSSMAFALFFLGECCSVILMSSLGVICFFGGWLPIISFGIFAYIPQWFWFAIKLLFWLFVYIWVRATLPRYRYDQLMDLCWKVILPLSLALLFVDASIIINIS